jgi:hypothetical protein
VTDIDMDAIEARLNAVGPNALNWQWRPFGGDPDNGCRVVDYSDFNETLRWDVVADDIMVPEHAEFIAHAPTDIAALLAVVRELRATLDRVSQLAAADTHAVCPVSCQWCDWPDQCASASIVRTLAPALIRRVIAGEDA